MDEYALANLYATHSRSQGWARRPSRWQQYGANYVQMYSEQIAALFNEGVVNSSAKKGPAQMRERLMEAVPTARYSLPSVAEIQTRISAFVMESKGNASGMVQETRRTTGKRDRKSKVPDEVQRFLDESASANPNIKPRDVVKVIRESFPDLVGIDGVALDDDQLTRAFTAAKKRQQSSN